MVVVRDEGFDLGFEIAWQEVVLQQDAVLQGLVPAFNLALRLRVIGCPTNMIHFPVIEPFSQIAGDVGRTVIGQQPWPVYDVGLIAT